MPSNEDAIPKPNPGGPIWDIAGKKGTIASKTK